MKKRIPILTPPSQGYNIDIAGQAYPPSIRHLAHRGVNLTQIRWERGLMIEVVAALFNIETSTSFKLALETLHREIQANLVNGVDFINRLRELGQLKQGEGLLENSSLFDEYKERVGLEEEQNGEPFN